MIQSKFKWNDYNTDKNDGGHSYCRAYDKFLSSKSEDARKVLEIGMRPGSANLWLDYFPKAVLYGVDIVNPNFSHERFVFRNVNQSNLKNLKDFFDEAGYDFDVIIDDGPHTAIEQITTFNLVFPKMKSGAIYIVEDLHVGDLENELPEGYAEMKQDSEHSFLELTKLLIDKNDAVYKNKYFTDASSVIDAIQHAELEKGDRIRWQHMRKPSDIAFFIRK